MSRTGQRQRQKELIPAQSLKKKEKKEKELTLCV
jgi:hypothetical protein